MKIVDFCFGIGQILERRIDRWTNERTNARRHSRASFDPISVVNREWANLCRRPTFPMPEVVLRVAEFSSSRHRHRMVAERSAQHIAQHTIVSFLLDEGWILRDENERWEPNSSRDSSSTMDWEHNLDDLSSRKAFRSKATGQKVTWSIDRQFIKGRSTRKGRSIDAENGRQRTYWTRLTVNTGGVGTICRRERDRWVWWERNSYSFVRFGWFVGVLMLVGILEKKGFVNGSSFSLPSFVLTSLCVLTAERSSGRIPVARRLARRFRLFFGLSRRTAVWELFVSLIEVWTSRTGIAGSLLVRLLAAMRVCCWKRRVVICRVTNERWLNLILFIYILLA